MKKYQYISSIILMLLIASCTSSPSDIRIDGTFNEDCELICEVKKSNGNFSEVNRVTIRKSPSIQKISLPFNKKNWSNVEDFIFTFSCSKPNSIIIQAIELYKISELTDIDLFNSIYWTQGINISFNERNQCTYYTDSSSGVFAIETNSFYLKYQKDHIKITLTIYFILLALLFIYFTTGNREKGLLLIAIPIFLVSLPLKISWSNWALAIFAITTVYLFIVNKNKTIKIQKPFYFTLLICIPMLIGTLYSTNSQSLEKLTTVTPLLAFPILFSMISFNKKEINTLLLFFILSTSLFCLYLLISFFILPLFNVNTLDFNPKNYFLFLLPYPSFYHPSFITIIITMTIPIAIYLKKERKINWFILLMAIILTCMVVVLSGARIGLIIVPLVLLLSISFYIKIPQRLKYFIVATIGVSILMAFINSTTSEVFSDTTRKDLRSTAIAALKEKPLFGWGTGSMETLLYSEDIAQKVGLEKPIAEFNHFHNQYLDMLVQFGIIGSLPFFALFIYLIYLAIKRKDFLLMAYLAIYLPFMFVESPFATAKGIQPMIFWLCFLISTQKIRLEKISNSSNDDKSELGAENT